MKKIIFVLVILINILAVKASKIDSLKYVLAEIKNDTFVINTLNKLAEEYININMDTAIMFVDSAMAYSEQKANKFGVLKSYKEYGIVYFYKGDFKKARTYFKEALIKSIELNNNYLIANLYYLVGATYYQNDDYRNALKKYKTALSIAQNRGYKDVESNCYNAIGILYKIQLDNKNAIKYYLKSLKLAEEDNNTEAISNLYNNIGVLYENQELFDNALLYYKKSISIFTSENNKISLIQTYNNIGVVYKRMEDYEKAIKYFENALAISEEVNSEEGLYKTYNNIGNVYKQQKQYEKAIETYNKALELVDNSSSNTVNLFQNLGDLYLLYSEEVNDNVKKYNFKLKAIKYSENAYIRAKQIDAKSVMKNAAYTLMQAYKILGNKSKSLDYALEYIDLNAKLYNIEKLKVINELEKKYNTEKDKLLIEKLQKEQELRNERVKRQQLDNLMVKRQRIVFMSLTILFILIITYVTLSLRKNKQLNAKLSTLNNEIESKSKELKLQYLQSVKQNIEIKTKVYEIEEQKKIITEKHKQLEEVTTHLSTSKEELKSQNEVLYRKNKEIEKQQLKIKEVIRQFEDTINNMEDVFIKTDRNFIHTQVSPSIKKYLDIESYDNIIGKPINEYWITSEQDLKQMTITLLRSKYLRNMLFKYKTAKGNIKYGRMNARALYSNNKFNGIEGIIRDVTSDIVSQNKIKELSVQKEVLINNIPSSIYYKDINLRYLEVNNHFAWLLGKTSDEIIGKTDNEVASMHITSVYEELDKKVIITKKPILNYIHKHIDNEGNDYWVSTSKLPYLDANNNVAGVIGVVRDITEQVKHEKEIQDSKNKIEKAHKHITDNINYAKTIQHALLPSKDVIDSYLPDCLVFFKPKEQVSGDFYYFKKFNEYVVFAAADCTGHGVSGGFLTMLGITHLNDIVSKKNTKNPAKALNLLRDKIKSTYKLFGSENRNGLDIALCALNTETNTLSYSGAFNPLWIVRNGELIEYKATRNPIGFYVNEKDFENHEIQLQKNDVIYIFSDGFADQFGGENDKKYSPKRFKQLLRSISELPMNEQTEKLNTEFSSWKGNREQVDDVVVIGVRV